MFHLVRADDGMNGGKCARIIDFCKLDIYFTLVSVPAARLSHNFLFPYSWRYYSLVFFFLLMQINFICHLWPIVLLRCTYIFAFQLEACIVLSQKKEEGKNVNSSRLWRFARSLATHSKCKHKHRARRNKKKKKNVQPFVQIVRVYASRRHSVELKPPWRAVVYRCWTCVRWCVVDFVIV